MYQSLAAFIVPIMPVSIGIVGSAAALAMASISGIIIF
jgi:hypothetical protein